MKRFNKFLALLLAVVMTVGMLPAAVSAASNDVLATSFEDITLPHTFTDVGQLKHEAYWGAGAGTIISTDGKTGTHSVKLTPSVHSNTNAFIGNSGNWLDPARVYGLGRLVIDITVADNFEVGQTYRAGAWFKTNRVGLKININVQEKNYTATGLNKDISWVDVGTEWTYKEVEFTPSENPGDYIKFRFGSSDYTSSLDDYVLVDDIRIYKVVPYGYQSVVDELAAGNAVLQTDVDGTGNDLVLKSGKTLDLAGCTLTVDSLVALKGANVIDSVGGGKLVAKDGISLDKNNTYVPVKDGNGYVFYQAFANTSEKAGLTAGVNSLSYADKPTLKTNEQGENVANALFANGAADNGISLVYRLSWTVEGKTVTMDVAFSDADIIAAHTLNAENQYSLIRLNATNVVDGATVSTVLVSDLGVEYVVNTATYTAVTE